MQTIHFSSLVDLKLVHLKSPLSDLSEIYTFMIRQTLKRYKIPQKEAELVERLKNRSIDDSILLPCGTAIPHLHLDGFDDTIISILVPEKPIITPLGDIKIFFLILSTGHDNTLYLHILKSIALLSNENKYLQRLRNAKTAKELHSVLKETELLVQRVLAVGDIMNVLKHTIKKNNTIEELSKLFYEDQTGYFLVTDDQDNLIGEVTVLDYIMAGFPPYTKTLKSLNFLKSLEPFEKLLQEEHEIKVEAVMRPIEISVSPDTSIFEAVFLMNKYHRRDLPVIQNKKPVGLISFMDVFRKVIKG